MAPSPIEVFETLESGAEAWEQSQQVRLPECLQPIPTASFLHVKASQLQQPDRELRGAGRKPSHGSCKACLNVCATSRCASAEQGSVRSDRGSCLLLFLAQTTLTTRTAARSCRNFNRHYHKYSKALIRASTTQYADLWTTWASSFSATQTPRKCDAFCGFEYSCALVC